MNLRTVAAVTGAIAVVYGLGFLLLPEALADVFAIERSDATVLIARFFGIHLVALGLVDWMARDAISSEGGVAAQSRTAIATGNVLSAVGSAALATWGVVAGTTNALAWGNVALTVLIAIAWTYYGFVRGSAASS